VELLYKMRSWSQARSKRFVGTARSVGVVTLTAMVVVLVALATSRPADAAFPETAFPGGHDPIAFEKHGDIWVASKMHLANLTPNTPSREVDPEVSSNGRYVIFASDRDGNFELYRANLFTLRAQRVTNEHGDDPT
jgi:WD40-like Beta Propeller Repeat